jgi:flavin reductase (DIM6/NTAB) family NADH-FMN oxidoreductase RutF
MKDEDCMAMAERVLRQIKKGAFLTVQADNAMNIMTIGWTSIGFMWGRSIMTILVRTSRFTFGLIERASDFTVSVPITDMKKELEFCGSHSGGKVDKMKKCGLKMSPGEKVKTPVLNIPGIHFECRIVYKSPLNPDALADSYRHLYPDKDYHTIYFGEIVHCYSTGTET